MAKRIRLYVDESGDHTRAGEGNGIGKRYLGLVGVGCELDDPTLPDGLDELKRTHFPAYDPDEPLVLHRADIRDTRGPFAVLRDETRRQAFDAELLRLVERVQCFVIGVVVDKATHLARAYRSLQHPYHYALLVLLERYVARLRHFGNHGDVMAEKRAKAEDRLLCAEYERIHSAGTYYTRAAQFQAALTTRHLKLKPKEANVAGLQLADLLAHPVTRDVLSSEAGLPPATGRFAAGLIRVVQAKYNKRPRDGVISGYGRILLR